MNERALERAAESQRQDSGRSRRGRVLGSPLALHVGVVALLTAISLWLFHSVFAGGHLASRLFDGQRTDASQQVWFLGYAAHLFTHPGQPFLSQLMYAGQGGFNLLSQTSVLALGALFAPVTMLLGPIATTNVATLLAPVATGYAMFVCLRLLTRSTFGQVFGAVLFAFLPATVGPAQGGHLMVTALWYPPLVLLCCTDLLVTKRSSPRVLGLFLGLLTVVQFFIGTEVLAMTATVTAAALVFAWATKPRALAVPWGRIRATVVVAGATSAVLLAYPLWFALAGPQHVTGPAWGVVTYAHYDASAIISSLSTASGSSTPGAGSNLSGAFLGWPLVLLATFALITVRRRFAWVVAFTCVFAWSLTWGRAFGSTNSWAVLLPMRALSHLPLFDAMLPTRFACFSGLAIAVLVAMGCDVWFERAKHSRAASSLQRRRVAMGVVSVVVALTLLPFALTYRPLPSGPVHEPWWFAHRSHSIPAAETVLVFPTYRSILYEAMERFPFKTVGGYAIIPDANGNSSFHGKREDLDTFLLDAEVLGNGLELRTPSQLTSIEGSLRRRGVDRVVILTKSLNAGYVAAVIVALTGARPTIDHRVMVWSDLRHHQFQPIDAQVVGAISSCALAHRQSAAVAASCVERELGLS